MKSFICVFLLTQVLGFSTSFASEENCSLAPYNIQMAASLGVYFTITKDLQQAASYGKNLSNYVGGEGQVENQITFEDFLSKVNKYANVELKKILNQSELDELFDIRKDEALKDSKLLDSSLTVFVNEVAATIDSQLCPENRGHWSK